VQPRQTESAPISDGEHLAQFVRRVREVNRKDNSLKESALTPKKHPFTKSVFRTDKMEQVEIEAAESRVMLNSGKDSIYGTVYFQKHNIEQCHAAGSGLHVEPEESDHRWHADIHWPTGDGPDAKALRTNLSQQLLSKTGQVVLRNP